MIDFTQPADIVAPQLLGAILRRGPVALRLTEVEAYLGPDDAASHAHKGPTPRCITMFGPPSRLYVYASYGIHRAGNIVCSPDGTATAVLLRAGEVVAGLDEVRRRRGDRAPDVGLARGPGNLGAALGLTLEDNGLMVRCVETDATLEKNNGSGALTVEVTERPVEFIRGRRIGISKNVDAPLRFWIPDDPSVTTPRSRRATFDGLKASRLR